MGGGARGRLGGLGPRLLPTPPPSPTRVKGYAAATLGGVTAYAWPRQVKPDDSVSGEGLSQNWMILLGHRRLQYIGEEPLGVAGS
jgi:hypothetical protein